MIEDVKKYFSRFSFPFTPFELNDFTRIENLNLFITSHLSIIDNYPKNPFFYPYLDRLIELKNKIEK